MNASPIVVPPGDVLQQPSRSGAGRRRSAPLRHERRRERDGPVNIGLWIPTTLIFALLAPFAVLLLPFLYLAPRRVIPNPARALALVGATLMSLRGTLVEVDAVDARIRIRLF